MCAENGERRSSTGAQGEAGLTAEEVAAGCGNTHDSDERVRVWIAELEAHGFTVSRARRGETAGRVEGA